MKTIIAAVSFIVVAGFLNTNQAHASDVQVDMCLRVSNIPKSLDADQILAGVKAMVKSLEDMGKSVKKVYANDDGTVSICLDLGSDDPMKSLGGKTKTIEL